jgi:STE24 endopeptidase
MAALGSLTKMTPLVVLPLFYKFTPLDRESLRARLVALSARAGVPVLGVYEWGLGEKTRRANAALVGTGATRRIIISDTLLAQFSDDEIEVVLAHELAHHVHRDILKSLAVEFGLLLAAFYVASRALALGWRSAGLVSPADVAGLPLLLIAGGATMLVATPFVNALSRLFERRADRYALELTRQPGAFISAMRRLAAQNLAEEHPSSLTLWLFHSHPPIEQRIAVARSYQ